MLKSKNNISAINGKYIQMEKVCYKCKETRTLAEFGNLKSSKDGKRYDCNHCRREYREANREQIKEKQRNYFEQNKSELLQKNKIYRESNIEKINEQRKEYRNREEVKLHIQEKNKEYLPIRCVKVTERRKTDLNFQISEVLRSKVHKMLHGQATSYQNLIGCDIDFFKKWIEFRFSNEMSWTNFGTYWHIDHIIPINAFNFRNENDKRICFHWTNLQPLEAKANMSKSDTFQMHYYMNNLVNVNRFNKIHNQFLGYQILGESLEWLRKTLKYGDNATYKTIDNQQPSR